MRANTERTAGVSTSNMAALVLAVFTVVQRTMILVIPKSPV